MSLKTADLVDAYDAHLTFCHHPLRLFGRRRSFFGPIATVRTFEDNSLIRRTLETPGEGRVLVVDGAGSTRVAVVGDMIAALGRDHGWAGLVINGAIRDVVEIEAMDFGVFALGHSPKKSAKANYGAVDVPVTFGNVTFVPGHILYGDDDGILVADHRVHERRDA